MDFRENFKLNDVEERVFRESSVNLSNYFCCASIDIIGSEKKEKFYRLIYRIEVSFFLFCEQFFDENVE